MVKIKNKTARITQEEPEEPEQPVEIESEDIPAELRKFLGDHNAGEMRVAVTVTPRGKPAERIPEEFGLELDVNALVEKYGGGKYTFRITEADGTYAGQITTRYADPKPAHAPAPVNTGLEKMLEVMQKQNEMYQLQMRGLQEKNDTLMIQLMGNMKDMFIAMAGKNDGKNEFGVLEVIKLMKEITPREDNVAKVVEVLRLGMDLRDSGGKDSSGWDRVIDMFVDKVKDAGVLDKVMYALQNKTQQRIPAPVAPPVPPAITIQPGVPPAPQAEKPALEILNGQGVNPVEEFIVKQVQNQLGTLVNFAKNNKDVSIVSDYVVEQLDENSYRLLKEYLSAEENRGKILANFPELLPYREWVMKLFGDIEHYYDEEPPAEMPESPENKENSDESGNPGTE